MYLRLHDIYLLAASSSALKLTGKALSSTPDQNKPNWQACAPYKGPSEAEHRGLETARMYRLASKSSPSLSSPNHDEHHHGRDWINCGLSSGYISKASTWTEAELASTRSCLF